MFLKVTVSRKQSIHLANHLAVALRATRPFGFYAEGKVIVRTKSILFYLPCTSQTRYRISHKYLE